MTRQVISSSTSPLVEVVVNNDNEVMKDVISNPDLGRSLFRNFVFMALCFSGNHGSVTSVIALASSFQATLGSYSVGTLYGSYVITAMFFGPYLISVTSAKRGLIASLALYSVYVSSYLVAVIFPASAWPAVLFGAAIGGIGAGLLWTAQGVYFKVRHHFSFFHFPRFKPLFTR